MACNRISNRYRRTALGLLWAMIGPLLLALIIGGVWGRILGRSFADFVPYLFCGLLPWQFLQESSSRGCKSLVDSAGLIQQTAVPMAVYPISSVIECHLNMLLALGGVSLLMVPVGLLRPWGIVACLPGLAILLVFGIGLGMAQATLGTIFRDLPHLSVLGLRVVFYVTPILYPVDLMERAGHSEIYVFNPFFYLIEAVRRPLLEGWFPPLVLVWAGLAAVLMGAAGLWMMCRVNRRLVYYL